MDEWLDIPDLIDRVQELLELGLFDEGKQLLELYADAYADEWELHFLFSRIYSETGNPKKSISFLEKGLQVDKDNQDCLLGLFYAYVQLDDLTQATTYLLRANKLYPDNELILNAMVWYHLEKNDFQKAIQCYQSAKSILDYNHEALRNVGIAYERVGDIDKALHCYKLSLELNPEVDETRDLLADHYIMRGEYRRSIALYKDALVHSPKNVRFLSRLIYCYSQDDQLNKARKTAESIISIYPNSPVGYVDLAYVDINSGDADAAILNADKALDVSPIDTEAMRVKAVALSETNKMESAKKLFERAIELSPNNIEILRDYYHYLKSVGNYSIMEQQAKNVIKMEYPYCIEDYWFLADFFLEQNQKRKAFYYLKCAYRSMPSERELIPPMVEILFELGHISSSVPILKNYIESKGWNDTMELLLHHKKLRGKRSQEGMRFMQFYGQNDIKFRSAIFSKYLKKFAVIGLHLLMVPMIIIVLLYLGLTSFIVATAIYLAGIILLSVSFSEKKIS